MLRTKSIIRPRDNSDGFRLSIMSRHTLNDGVTPNVRITESSYDYWFKLFAPPEKLIGNYYRNKSLGLNPWERFEVEYLDYLKRYDVKTEVQNLARMALDFNITLLCVEDFPEECHRRVFAEECRRYEPSLDLCIN